MEQRFKWMRIMKKTLLNSEILHESRLISWTDVVHNIGMIYMGFFFSLSIDLDLVLSTRQLSNEKKIQHFVSSNVGLTNDQWTMVLQTNIPLLDL